MHHPEKLSEGDGLLSCRHPKGSPGKSSSFLL
jgi:hypothetical protein